MEFFKTPAGIAVFTVVAVIVAVFVIDVNYKYFFKYVLDFIFALIALILLAPVICVFAVIIKIKLNSHGGGTVFEREYFYGAKGKIIVLRSFAVKAENGEDFGAFSKYLNSSAVKYFPRVLDILCGRISIVGVKPMKISDACFVSDEFDGKFAARPGVINPLIGKCDKETDYEQIFALELAYVKKRELFKDIWYAVKNAVYKIRGEKFEFGESDLNTYAKTLLVSGRISENDYNRAIEYERSVIAGN